MATGTVRSPDYLVNTSFATNTTGAIGADDAQDGAESSHALSSTTQTASYTAAITDRGTCVLMNSASAINFNVPTNASVGFPIGSRLYVIQYGAGQITLQAVTPGTTTIRNASSNTTRTQYSMVALLKIATDEWVLSGDVT